MDFNSKVQEYRKAIEQEFGKSLTEATSDMEAVFELARKGSQPAMLTLVSICQHSVSDRDKIAASKAILDFALKAHQLTKEDDPITTLIEKLTTEEAETP